jgi:hypothetical protein
MLSAKQVLTCPSLIKPSNRTFTKGLEVARYHFKIS